MTDAVEKIVQLQKFDAVKRLVGGEVLVPDTEDAQGDVASVEEIEQAAHNYLRKYRVVGDKHETVADAEVVESYIAPADFQAPSGAQIKKGSWVMVVKVHSDEMWQAVLDGDYTGFSIGGTAYRDEI